MSSLDPCRLGPVSAETDRVLNGAAGGGVLYEFTYVV